MTEAGYRDPSSRNVVLIGRDSLQNRLLANLIRERVGCGCVLRPIEQLGALPLGANQLALLDTDGIDARHIADRLQRLAFRAGSCAVALMNVDDGVSLEQIVGWPGIKGIFFRQNSQDNLIRGIQAIFNGECWLPRRILSARWEQTTLRRLSRPTEDAHLSRKEVETLILLVGGNSNDYIARKLNVSTHTVKSHVYRLYRKLQVRNRVQAVQWALQHIDGVENELR
jgi:DNA-binding NarL/FixJ family response regulator